MASSTFEQALDARLRHDPGQPLVTFYDDATGERTELSTTTYANWVAKTAGVLVEDLDLTEGASVRLDLPTHWLGPVFLGAAWLAGLEVVGGEEPGDLLVLGPDGLSGAGGGGGGATERLLCALDPFAGRFRGTLPAGVLDYGTLWPGQPDSYLGLRARPGTTAYAGTDWQGLLDASARAGTTLGDRVLSDVNPVSSAGVDLFVATLVGGGSVVWVADPDPGRWSHRAETEQATREVRSS